MKRTAPRRPRRRSEPGGEAMPAVDRQPAALSPLDLGALPEMTGYALRRAQLAVFADAIDALATLELRPAQFSVLLVIGRNPGRKQSEIAEALGIQRPNFVALMDGLDRRGLARRMSLVTDRRSYAVVLTGKGETLLAEALEVVAAHEARVRRFMQEGEHETFLRALASINAAMGSAAEL